MKQRPILFSAPMVRALLAGTKTQTRRVLKRQPEPPRAIYGSPGADTTITPNLYRCENGMGVAWRFEMSKITSSKGRHLEVSVIDHEPVRIVCPYGNPGDRLWVRENGWQRPADRAERGWPYAYDADAPFGIGAANEAYREAGWKRRPSIHMPRWASRILLEVTDVRVERLKEISEADAMAEGIERSPSMGKPGALQWCDYRMPHNAAEWFNSPIHSYETLWDQINGTGAWAANPWVWAVSFRSLPSTGGNSISLPQGSTALHRRESS